MIFSKSNYDRLIKPEKTHANTKLRDTLLSLERVSEQVHRLRFRNPCYPHRSRSFGCRSIPNAVGRERNHPDARSGRSDQWASPCPIGRLSVSVRRKS